MKTVNYKNRKFTFLQNLGKVDRTADDILDEHLQNFTRQQYSANRLQKEFNNYIRCVRAVQVASKTLMDSLNEIYESQWTGHDLLYVQAQNLDMLWQDFTHKLADQVLVPLNTYQSQFPEMRKKIDKRGRKLVDYDSQRHNFQSLQCNLKKRDEIKVSRGKELLEEAKRTYEQLNSELHDELPALYDSRVLFLVTNLQTLFAAEQVFHAESAKVYSELEAIVDKLANESQRGSYTLKKNTEPQSPKSPNANSTLKKKKTHKKEREIEVGRKLVKKSRGFQRVWYECALLRVAAVEDSVPPARDTSPTTQLNGNANSNANSNDNSLNNQDASPQSTVVPTKCVEELYDIPVATSEEDDIDFVQQRVISGEDYSMDCCLCQEHYNKKKSTKYLINDDIKARSNRLRSQRARENMELRLIGSQVEEALGDDRQAVLIQQLDLVSNALEALIHYIQSLQVTNLATQRIMDVGHLLINSRSSLSDGNSTSFKFLTGQIQQVENLENDCFIHQYLYFNDRVYQIENKEKCRASFLQDLKEHCSKSMTMSKQLRILIEEHKSRKEDFSIAAKNFQNFLNKSKLSSSQLEKLRRQYDTILEDYQESRQILDVRLPKVVNARLVTLHEGFVKEHNIAVEIPGNVETCQLCQTTNRVDKK
ncbi:hypothetical protein HZH66_010050 [Vespula vulgaris]|uniref:BAR domain-containing protein n=1 Tax=Vespula vulgaris TaxID=7454 RepID=A0A834JIA7_VESVU|nr:hypothetical protein HZH66_010050 [Vespula vulgaris]